MKSITHYKCFSTIEDGFTRSLYLSSPVFVRANHQLNFMPAFCSAAVNQAELFNQRPCY